MNLVPSCLTPFKPSVCGYPIRLRKINVEPTLEGTYRVKCGGIQKTVVVPN